MAPTRYLSLAVLVLAAVPASAQEKPLRQVIDEQVEAAWKERKINPVGPADDAVFLRRIYLDLVGTIPTYEETKAFLADAGKDRRAKLIDRLLEDPRYAQNQADVWDMVLFGRNPPGYHSDKRDGFRRWLREQFAGNVPYDRWVSTLLHGEGNTVDQGAPMYLIQFDRQPEEAIMAISQTFLGVQLQCANCHDHPFESWTQRDFYGMAAFLARLQLVEVGKAGPLPKLAVGEKNTGDILFTGPAKDQTPGKKGEPVRPRFLRGAVLEEPVVSASAKEERFPNGKMPPKPRFSRKDRLADWITAPDNPYFARAVANRVWGQFIGRGIVNPVDNLSETNPPTHPALLQALAEGLVKHGFDLKWYVRELVNSRTYQLAATGDVEETFPLWFERARVRPLSAEELIASWRTATGYEAAEQGKKNDDRYRPLGSGYLLRFFGQPNNGVGEFQGGLHEHLYLNNGPIGQVITSAKGGLMDTLLTAKDPWEQRVERLFLSVLSRPPRPEERAKFVAFLTAKPDETSARVNDAIWVLMTCSEFRFNH